MAMVGLRDVFVVAPAASFHHQDSLFPPSADNPIIPLLTASPCLVSCDDPHGSRSKSSAHINLWHQHQQNPNPNPNPNSNPNPNPYLKKPVPLLDTAGILASSSGCTATCQDCGNQAKKDCTHRRCRTCCKSRGFDCSTHVKSTWVPAARRRERQLSTGARAAGSSASASVSTSAPKKPRLSQTTTTSHTSTSNTTRSFDTSSSHQDASFRESLPVQVTAPAVFKCVRVSSVSDDGEDEFAYQAMVNIRGHVFKGFLYDHGEDDCSENLGITAAGSSAIPNISELHLGGGSAASARHGSSSGAAMIPGDIYGGGGGLLGGANNYGN